MQWRRAVTLWRERVVGARLAPTKFGEARFWEDAYRREAAPEEWYLGAVPAARAARAAYVAARRPGSPRRAQVAALHLGCGTSTLGSALCSAFGPAPLTVESVLNVDVSEAALAALRRRQAGLPHADRQAYLCWDASAGVAPPGRFDLLLDKGVLDALECATPDALLAYLGSLRACLAQSRGLLVHWSDHEPEECVSSLFPLLWSLVFLAGALTSFGAPSHTTRGGRSAGPSRTSTAATRTTGSPLEPGSTSGMPSDYETEQRIRAPRREPRRNLNLTESHALRVAYARVQAQEHSAC